jgi:lipid II:glycine glycyltransferase (peptidoglycan interpeptide bridge formation enzyme)
MAKAFRGTDVFHVFTASLGGRCAAAQLAFVWYGYVFLAGVSVADWTLEKRIPANDLLQFGVLDWAREHRCRTVDFVGAHPGTQDSKIRAIDAFKARWGTTIGESLELSLPGSDLRRRALRLAQMVGR